MKPYYYLHVPFFLVPILFIFFCTYKISHHWSDGKEGSRYYANRMILKIFACLVESAFEVAKILIPSPSGYYSQDENFIRLAYFSLLAFTWVLSGYLVYFEYERRIKPNWFGQKGFWVTSLIATTALLTLNVMGNNYFGESQEVRNFYLIETILYCFCISFELFLTYVAIFKPNDFFIDRMIQEALNESVGDLEESCPMIALVSGYKVKSISGNQATFFEIVVSLGKNSKKVSRLFQEFENLHSLLDDKYCAEYLNIDIPKNPKTLSNVSIENRVAGLNDYLRRLCEAKMFTQELLEFLSVPEKLQDELKGYFHRYDTTFTDVATRSQSEFDNYFNQKTTKNETLTISLPAYHLNWMIDIQIPSWTRTDSHIEYSIKAEIRILSFEVWITSRYSEILELHKNLLKLRIPVPHFPSKSLRRFKNIYSDAISIRRSQLEDYLGKIYNDPAYLHVNSLKFINCSIEIERILAIIPKGNRYELILPMKWEGEIGNDASQYIAYVMRFTKDVLGKSQEWEVTRRFREFADLHKALLLRNTSFLLQEFLEQPPDELPELPNRSLTPLCTCDEIENRKNLLEKYIMELLKNPGIPCSYEFRMFIGEIEY
jgi:hypothetical protein